ncbi:MAG: cytochrome b/b6 domain-containing protein [Magnetospirillum sp.]|nr:cytochrome b/b6 domain-containing protein [Magnetospirillum sp.]
MTARSNRYDPVLQSLHWLMAAVILVLWGMGVWMEDLPKGPFRADVYGLHKSLGVLVLLLVAVRWPWRRWHGVPELPAAMPAWEQRAAHLGYLGLYLLMVGLPVSGILMSQTGGRDVALFGLGLPTVIGKHEMLHEVFEGAHGLFAWTLAALLGSTPKQPHDPAFGVRWCSSTLDGSRSR